jgi:hypothetical protein
VQVDDAFAVERRIHAAFIERRVMPDREFFRATTEESLALIALVAHVQAPPLELEPHAREATTGYEELKALFESRRFKTATGTLLFHTVNAISGQIESRSKKAFTAATEDWIPDGGRRFLQAWYADGNKRSYDHIEYGCVKLEEQESAVYYAFPELRHESLLSSSSPEEKQASVDYFLDYVRLLVGDNPAHVEWMVMWLADILVNPHEKGPITLVLRGEQGAGRIALRELMSQLLGARLVHRTSDLNAKLKCKLFVELEDIDLNAHSRGRVNALVARKTAVKATERVLITTGAAPVDRDDGHYAEFVVSGRRVGDEAYWDAHYGKLGDPSYVKDVADYLASHKSNLMTYALRDRFRASTAPELSFLGDMFVHATYGQAFIAPLEYRMVNDAAWLRPNRRPAMYMIPSSLFCREYNQWRADRLMVEQVSNKNFTMTMLAYGSGYGIRSDKGSKCNSFLVDVGKLRAALASL